jgi:hypothetical protein
MNNENEIKGRMALHRLVATLALIGALSALHYAYALHNSWGPWVFGVLTGYLCALTIRHTLKAAIYAAGLVTVEAFRKANR